MITDFVAFDTETALIDAGLLAPPMACLTYCDTDLQPGLLHWREAEEYLAALLSDRNLVGANVAFDAAVICAQYPRLMPAVFRAYEESRILCVRLNQRLLDLAVGELDGWSDRNGVYHKRTYSLTALSQRYGYGEMEKDQYRLTYGQLRELPLSEWPAGAIEYAKTDALRTYQVFSHQLEREEFLQDAAAQARAAFALHLMSCHGLVTDNEACLRFIDRTKDEIEKARLLLLREGLVDDTGKRKTKVAKAYMERTCNSLGLPVPMTTKGKDASDKWKPSVCLDAEACRDTGDEVLMSYSTYTSANTLIKKAEILLKGSYGTPLQTSFEPLLETGRTSSRAPSPPLVGDNFQNVRRAPGMREVFVPRPGYVYCSVDYSMAELRTVSQICLWVLGKSELAKALNEGKDVHCVLAANMLGKSYEWTIENKKSKEVKDARQRAKSANFGAWGGLGPKAFVAYCSATGLRISLAQAQEILGIWKATWSESKEYFAWVNHMLQEGLATYKSFISGRVRGRINFTAAANNGFQALAADAAKSALLPIAKECYVDRTSPLFGSRPVLFIHDEVIAELPEDKAHEAAFRMRDLMVDCFNWWTPDVPVTAEPAIARRWFKDMEARYENGRLVCWEPEEKKAA